MKDILDADDPIPESKDPYLGWLGVSMILHLVLYIDGTLGNFCRFHALGIAITLFLITASFLVYFFLRKLIWKKRWVLAGLCIAANVFLGLGNYMIIC
ncbi:hypothetical protein [Flavilitoribacter nigricans]|uniref:Uncharacterized protein n=1 Tax=Flavilitoribacter nigricans (strain ATCC 23147 / DSM 23189 / NBRC 102662 / NCIMB 1420 / SS-2) TaxID=1122177 RepID=A0A2D0N1Q6_FLAN2|nr:hypothetical protein [Flavilitoribacter nigricans]PHN02069.1 hypothetical protein CRP01_34110 [Flavilitoribacter nigricans DSM 23189 = NBRC 102662]